jgi:hypothetical protein
MTKEYKLIIREEVIASKIFTLRDEKVILDVHLAELYEVETRALKQAVRRNKDRFPNDFMYELTGAEIDDVVSQNVIPSKKHLGGAIPFAFTEKVSPYSYKSIHKGRRCSQYSWKINLSAKQKSQSSNSKAQKMAL